MLIYSVAGGQPDALLFEYDIEAVPSDGGLVEFGIADDISGVDPAADYALIIIVVDNFTVSFGKRDTTGTTHREEGITFGSPPSTFHCRPTTATLATCRPGMNISREQRRMHRVAMFVRRA